MIYLVSSSPPWVIGLFSAIALGIFYLVKSLFSSSSKPEYSSSNEERIFEKELNVKNKSDMLERIDYWIDKSNFQEAKKLTNLYIDYNQSDENIQRRATLINKHL
jgi:hypothetical protein